jgi:hypothetical protein
VLQVNWFRKLLANLRAAQDRTNQERWDREQKRRRDSLEYERSSAQMRADIKAAEAWLEREMEQTLRDTLR